ncbi:hypothetical protein NCAS_0I02880 [Naumovozyma castellii]|uniref:Histone-lysine N-methyltransferase, H3 lysine-36 specific n=1 Tax=Naumovozyma castellii TaxID=27288 RepID=G0VKC2_NAUCA|nr:hypothetical protein NCAS_0I02880 [Naumovozyma castellii CBS 4309]CCC71956.1 hypothetical protein NCAS_0I02880 [Naumovozyma castellii CBS 4309]
MTSQQVHVNDSIPKLFTNEEDKTDEVLATFTELKKCTYSSKKLGNSKNNDFIECDCYEDSTNGVNHACDENSDCINRLTLIECVNDLCYSCGNDCQNQRFQKSQYADISIFKTKMKGYGVRANADIETNEFIYEYTGEVIDEEIFRDRMIEYDEKKFKHFYFMMLQNCEFIDATLKGSLARFCNHSCNPNAYVNKWEVAGKLRMGIFASRKIIKGEEITFDYNVDRYGATAQKCYCEEPNCIGFLGGKTQTDAASLLPQSYADALGIKVSMEKEWIKKMKEIGVKIKKHANDANNNVNIDFVESIDIQPCQTPDDVRKVMSVLLQVDNEYIALKLFHRLYSIEDEILLHQVIKLHGYICFAKLLKTFADEINTEEEILELLERLPKTTKNGITSSQIDTQVSELSEEIPSLKEQCDMLLNKWDKYETYRRITKKDISESSTNRMIDLRRIRLPLGWEIIYENGRPIYFNAQRQIKLNEPPTEEHNVMNEKTNNNNNDDDDIKRHGGSVQSHDLLRNKRRREHLDNFVKKQKNGSKSDPWQRSGSKSNDLIDDPWRPRRGGSSNRSLDSSFQEEKKFSTPPQSSLEETVSKNNDELLRIIEEANKQKEQEREEELQREREKEEKRLQRKSKSQVNVSEHKWNKFFASFVPNLVRKNVVGVKLSHDHIKECSRDIVKILTSKELKKDDAKSPPEDLTREKKKKTNSFVKVYMEKFIEKYKSKKHSHKH